jgi:hypothetical protein
MEKLNQWAHNRMRFGSPFGIDHPGNLAKASNFALNHNSNSAEYISVGKSCADDDEHLHWLRS